MCWRILHRFAPDPPTSSTAVGPPPQPSIHDARSATGGEYRSGEIGSFRVFGKGNAVSFAPAAPPLAQQLDQVAERRDGLVADQAKRHQDTELRYRRFDQHDVIRADHGG